MKQLNQSLIFILTALLPLAGYSADEDTGWHELELIDKSLQVNEGELIFIDPIADFDKHQITNRYIIRASSLDTGWVELVQCHRNLDPVAESQIVYRYNGLKDLKVDSSKNIKRAWVEQNTVQLEDVGNHSTICISAQVQILRTFSNGLLALRSGPFYRRFLDGYYPINVRWEMDWQSVPIKVAGMRPQSEKGLRVEQSEHGLIMDAWFEGKLTFVIAFERLPAR